MRIVLTREAERGDALAAELRAKGHEVSCVPLTAVEDVEPFPDPSPFDGVLFTSVNAVAIATLDASPMPNPTCAATTVSWCSVAR